MINGSVHNGHHNYNRPDKVNVLWLCHFINNYGTLLCHILAIIVLCTQDHPDFH